MRSTASFAAGLVAVLALLVALPAGWVATHVSSQDGFVDLVGPLATDAAVRDVVVDEVASALSSQDVLPVSLPSSLQSVVKATVRQEAARVAGDPGWQRAWDESLARTHRSLLDTPDGSGRIVVDVAPVADYVLSSLSGPLPVRLKAPQTLPVLTQTVTDQEGVDAVRKAPEVALLAAVVGVLVAALCIGLARQRSVAVAALGLGAVVVALVAWPVVELATSYVADHQTSGGPLARTLVEQLMERSKDSVHGWLLVTVVAGFAGVVLGAIGGAVGRSRSTAS